MHANFRNGREARLPDASATTKTADTQLSAAFRTALGASSQKHHPGLLPAAGKHPAAMGKAERNDRAAKTVAARPAVPRTGHR